MTILAPLSVISAGSEITVDGYFVGPDGPPMAGVVVDLRLVSNSVSAAAQSGSISEPIIATAQTDDAGHFALSASGTAQVLGVAQANGGYANLQIEAVTDTAMLTYYFSAQNTVNGWVTSATWPKNFTIGAGSPGVTPLSRTVARSLAASIRGVSPDFIELITKDQHLDVVVPILGRAACERDEPAQK
jgi:hypothetical protein